MTKSAIFADVLVALERQYHTYETDLSIKAEIQNLAVLPNNPTPARVSELLADLDHWAGRLTPRSYSSDDLLFWLVAKLPRELWDECLSTAERKARALVEKKNHLGCFHPRLLKSKIHGVNFKLFNDGAKAYKTKVQHFSKVLMYAFRLQKRPPQPVYNMKNGCTWDTKSNFQSYGYRVRS